jgi:hypothetical protein
VSDEQTMTVLRDAADAAVRDHRLEPGVAAAAWSAAHTPRRLAGHRLAIAAGVLGAAGVASALVVWGSTGGHPGPPAGGSACEGNVTTARLPSWARAGFSPAGLHTPHVLSDGGDIIAVLFVNLRVHQPAGTHNKILWVAKVGYGPLNIRAQLEGTSRIVARTLPDGPGPSYVNMPAAGCWQMSLTWSGYHDTMALRYGV